MGPGAKFAQFCFAYQSEQAETPSFRGRLLSGRELISWDYRAAAEGNWHSDEVGSVCYRLSPRYLVGLGRH
jgi:hypothetical protein